MKGLKHHCLQSLLERPNFIGTDLKVPSAYLVCKGDHCVPISAQEATIAGVPGMKRFECEGGHSAMLAMPDVVADYIVKVAVGVWEGSGVDGELEFESVIDRVKCKLVDAVDLEWGRVVRL